MVIVFLAVVTLFLPLARPWLVSICVSLIPLFALALSAAVPLAAVGKEDAPAVPLLAGWAVVLAGAACDIFATVANSPDLQREANPVLRALLDNGVSLTQVFLFGGVLQVLFVALTMVLLLGLLKHRRTLAATMPPSGSLLAYFKAGTGGRETQLPPMDLPAGLLGFALGLPFCVVDWRSFRRALGLPLLPGIGVVPAGPAASPLGPFHRPFRRITSDVLVVRSLAPGRTQAGTGRKNTTFPGKFRKLRKGSYWSYNDEENRYRFGRESRR
jgi:hypothetical protein